MLHTEKFIRFFFFQKKSIKGINLSIGEKKFARAPAGVALDLSVVCTDRASMVKHTKIYKIFSSCQKNFKKNSQFCFFALFRSNYISSMVLVPIWDLLAVSKICIKCFQGWKDFFLFALDYLNKKKIWA